MQASKSKISFFFEQAWIMHKGHTDIESFVQLPSTCNIRLLYFTGTESYCQSSAVSQLVYLLRAYQTATRYSMLRTWGPRGIPSTTFMVCEGTLVVHAQRQAAPDIWIEYLIAAYSLEDCRMQSLILVATSSSLLLPEKPWGWVLHDFNRKWGSHRTTHLFLWL